MVTTEEEVERCCNAPHRPSEFGHYHFPQRDNAGVVPRIPARKLLRNHELVEGQHEQQPAYGRAVPRYRQRSGRIRRRKSERWPKAEPRAIQCKEWASTVTF